MSNLDIHIHKFGGTSMGDSDCISKVAELISQQKTTQQIIVVSAMKGVTTHLVEACLLAQQKNDNYKNNLNTIRTTHITAIDKLISEPYKSELFKQLDADLIEIQDLLKGVWLAKSLPESTLEMVSGYGELWSSLLLTSYLNQKGQPAERMDTRDFLTIKKGEIGPVVLWEKSLSKLNELQPLASGKILVATGFIARNEEGINTTLGRNGSDFTASILGKLFSAKSVCIWTDVDGVFSADPRYVPEAQLVEHLTYQEAMELAYFGAKVLHPHTMGPAIEKEIEIKIRNTFNPKCEGTLITKQRDEGGLAVKGFATIEHIALLNVEGSSMVGVPGVAQRLFGSLKEVGVSVVLISQASSEHSICFAIPNSQTQLAEKAIRETFFNEIHHGRIQSIQVFKDCSILAAVGDNMAETPGVSGKFFTSLGNAGVNVRAIAQGSSERNISAVIDSHQTIKALNAVHAAFYLSNFTLSIGLIGPGIIGKTLISQIQELQEKIIKDSQLDLRIRGICNSKNMLLDKTRLDVNKWEENFKSSTLKANLEEFANHIHADHIPHSVIIDCTASETVAEHYCDWLEKGIHIITPNKKASSANIKSYNNLQNTLRENNSFYFYEATVGAGLPIISTLKDLIETGDEILKIEGIFSGTLSHIFNELNVNTKFSDIVSDAKQRGFTEPDPRDDLSGMDVARKVVILAREAGYSVDLTQIPIESLIPSDFPENLTIDEFMQKLPSLDDSIKRLVIKADEIDSVIKYVGSIDKDGNASVGIKSYSKDHPFARLTGTDNIIAFTTQRYFKQPLIVQGPGAGPEVTAAGVFADLLRLANHLGAKLR